VHMLHPAAIRHAPVLVNMRTIMMNYSACSHLLALTIDTTAGKTLLTTLLT
jgi:hypothetical protein